MALVRHVAFDTNYISTLSRHTAPHAHRRPMYQIWCRYRDARPYIRPGNKIQNGGHCRPTSTSGFVFHRIPILRRLSVVKIIKTAAVWHIIFAYTRIILVVSMLSKVDKEVQFFCSFYRAACMQRGPSDRKSVCPSVCPSVRPSVRPSVTA